MTDLIELQFTDLYVRLDGDSPSRYAPIQQRSGPTEGNLEVPGDYDREIELLRGQLIRQKTDDFSLDLAGMRLRGSRCHFFLDQTWVALRRFPVEPPNLADLGFSPLILEEFRSWGDKTGLVVIGGSTGAGKTTTAVALLIDFLRTHGKLAFTIEDPVEYSIQGPHGDDGFAMQVPVHDDNEWALRVKTALRWKPRYIFLGEVRTPEAAKWLLRAATSGHMAICTIHGGSIEETLSAILQTAQSALGETAKMLLADGLCAVVHQEIVQGRPRIKLLTAEAQAADPVRTAIRTGTLTTLGTYIDQQASRREIASTAPQDGRARADAQRRSRNPVATPTQPTSRPTPPAASRDPARHPAAKILPSKSPALRKKFLGIF